VLLWFVVLAPIMVAEVFRSPMVDYRLVALGSLLPMLDLTTGTFSGLHTLAGSVAALGVVMLGTMRRRLARRRLLGVPIGLFCHLVLDGTWTRTKLFWWPASGWARPENPPEQGHSPAIWLVMELAAAALAVWAWRRYGLAQAENRQLLVRRGHLNRGVLK
jgi:hypothetical protein